MTAALPQTPVGRQLTWMLASVGPGVVLTDIEERFAPLFLKTISPDQIASFFHELGPLRAATIDRLEGTEYALEAVLVVGGQRVQVLAQVEHEAPHRFVALSFRSGPSLPQILDETKPAGGSVSDAVKERFGSLAERVSPAGVVVGVVCGDDEEIISFGNIVQDGIFEIGSITKVFTGVLLAEMASRGELALDDAVQKHLPKGVTVPQRGDRPITLLDLATHTSGLPRLPPGFDPKDWSNPYADFTVEKLYEALSRTELLFETASRAEYSNYAYGLLGHVLSRAAGVSYGALVAERICAPLRLTDTFVEVPKEWSAARVQGHDRAGQHVPHWDAGAILGAGGIESSIQDMLRFVGANLHPSPGKIGAALDSAQHPRLGRHVVGVLGGSTVRGERHQMGLGWDLFDRSDGTTVAWKSGATGGFRSSCAVHRPSGTAIVALSNSSGADLDPAVLATLVAIACASPGLRQ